MRLAVSSKNRNRFQETSMKNIDENTKVTLTLKQLKRLIAEAKKQTIEPRTTDKWSIVDKAGKYLSYDYSFSSHGFDSNIRKLLRFKSKEGAEKYIVNNRLSDFCKEHGAKVVPSPFVVRFSASGFSGGKPRLYPNWESLMNDAQSVADDHDGKVKDWGDLVVTADGQEIARWEIL